MHLGFKGEAGAKNRELCKCHLRPLRKPVETDREMHPRSEDREEEEGPVNRPGSSSPRGRKWPGAQRRKHFKVICVTLCGYCQGWAESWCATGDADQKSPVAWSGWEPEWCGRGGAGRRGSVES